MKTVTKLRRRLAWLAGTLAVLLFGGTHAANKIDERPLFELDGDSFVTFYDLPSRRFHRIRQGFVTRDFESVRHDIEVSAQYLQIESQRALPGIQGALNSVIERMRGIAGNLEAAEVRVQTFDPLFGRVHWLLAQHFLHLAIVSRETERYAESGRYLVACAHHMERAALWSNARITPELERSIDRLRNLADRLQDSPSARWLEETRPLQTAVRTLRVLGEHIDRQVLLEAPAVDQ